MNEGLLTRNTGNLVVSGTNVWMSSSTQVSKAASSDSIREAVGVRLPLRRSWAAAMCRRWRLMRPVSRSTPQQETAFTVLRARNGNSSHAESD